MVERSHFYMIGSPDAYIPALDWISVSRRRDRNQYMAAHAFFEKGITSRLVESPLSNPADRIHSQSSPDRNLFLPRSASEPPRPRSRGRHQPDRGRVIARTRDYMRGMRTSSRLACQEGVKLFRFTQIGGIPPLTSAIPLPKLQGTWLADSRPKVCQASELGVSTYSLPNLFCRKNRAESVNMRSGQCDDWRLIF